MDILGYKFFLFSGGFPWIPIVHCFCGYSWIPIFHGFGRYPWIPIFLDFGGYPVIPIFLGFGGYPVIVIFLIVVDIIILGYQQKRQFFLVFGVRMVISMN
jgi:hypothetical protein